MRKTLSLLAVLALSIGSPLNVLLATDYYLSPSGDDSTGDGSSGSPWRSITRAMQSAASGDVIHVAAGGYLPATGESFPITIKHGVTLQGPDSGDPAIVQCPTQTGMFRLEDWNGDPTPTIIEKLTLDHTLGSQSGDQDAIELWQYDWINVQIRSNEIHAAGHAIHLEWPQQDVLIEGNTILNDPSGGTGAGAWIDGHAQSVEIRNNHIQGMEFGLNLNVRAQGMELVDNVIENSEKDGVFLDPELAGLNGRVQGNTITGSGDYGLRIFQEIRSSLGASSHAPIRYNTIAHNRVGVLIRLSASGSSSSPFTGWSRLEVPFEGNIVALNDQNGVRLTGSTRDGPFDIAFPDFGGGATGLEKGRNTFLANGGFDFAEATFEPLTIQAQGNWWGTTDTGVIASHVDGSVVFANPLEDPLAVQLSTTEILRQGGTLVKASAGPTSAFVAYVGERKLEVTVDGLPAENVQVSEDGSRLSFRTPRLSHAGLVPLVITNPNQTTFTAMLEVKPFRWIPKGPLSSG